MELRRWDYKTHSYLPHLMPAGNYKTFCHNMDEVVNCAQCGKPLPYGGAYTSMEVHTDIGFGYAVCGACYDGEMYRRTHKEGHECA